MAPGYSPPTLQQCLLQHEEEPLYPVYLQLAPVRGLYEHASIIVHESRFEYSPRGVVESPTTSRSSDRCLFLGMTPKTLWEARSIVRGLENEQYSGRRYSTLVRNCYDFAEDLASALLGSRGAVTGFLQEAKHAVASATVGGAVASGLVFPQMIPFLAAGLVVSQLVEKVVPRLGLS